MTLFSLRPIIYFFVLSIPLFHSASSQESRNAIDVSKMENLFLDSDPLSVRLEFSSKNIKQKTNDGQYAETIIQFKSIDSIWITVPAKIKGRGNFRLEKCNLVPIKVKIQTFNSSANRYKGVKTLKLVQPCFLNKQGNDNLLKEYIAYKLYEIISPYHFKTRLLKIDFSETKKTRKTKRFKFPGFLIEPIGDVAKRLHGTVVDAKLSSDVLDDRASIRFALFQFLIGNTDFSTVYHHNCKLIYADNKYIPIPYDFDLSGLVNPTYAVVSNIENQTLELEKVTQRLYRGMKRDEKIVQEVRKEFLLKKEKILKTIMTFENDFDNSREYRRVVEFVNLFFEIIKNNRMFQKRILEKARAQ